MRLVCVSVLVACISACSSSDVTVSAPSSNKCQVSADPSLKTAPADGGVGTLSVTTTRDCTWDASSAAQWIAFTGSASGQGSGDVGYRVSANVDPVVRRGTLTVNGTQLTISQDAAACHYAVTPASTSVNASGGTVSVQVQTASSACSWTSNSSVAWVHVPGASQGGSAAITVRVDANDGDARSASVTVAGQIVRIDQPAEAGVPSQSPTPTPIPPGCSYRVAPAEVSIGAAGGTGTVTVTTTSICSWTTASDSNWASVTAGGSGTGNGTVSYSVGPNPSISTRSAKLTIADQVVTITQAAGVSVPGCSYSVSPTAVSVPAGGASGSVAVTTTGGCQWTATFDVNWASVTAGASGSGNGSASYSVSANASTSPRTATMTIAGRTVTFTQSAAAAACSYSISPTSATLSADSATVTVSVTAASGCAWTATSNDGFISVNSGSSGTGNGTVSLDVGRYKGTGSRTGTVTIAGQTFTVTQTK